MWLLSDFTRRPCPIADFIWSWCLFGIRVFHGTRFEVDSNAIWVFIWTRCEVGWDVARYGPLMNTGVRQGLWRVFRQLFVLGKYWDWRTVAVAAASTSCIKVNVRLPNPTATVLAFIFPLADWSFGFWVTGPPPCCIERTLCPWLRSWRIHGTVA